MRHKFTDEELSRILSASAAGQIRRFGGIRTDEEGHPFQQGKVCLVQAALNLELDLRPYGGGDTIPERYANASLWFDYDAGVRESWTPQQLLTALERKGYA